MSHILWKMNMKNLFCLTSMVLHRQSFATWLYISVDSCMDSEHTFSQLGRSLSATKRKTTTKRRSADMKWKTFPVSAVSSVLSLKTCYVWLTVASLHMLHFTTCWCILPSTDMALWQTRQLMTGALLLSGLPCGEYGGGGSPSTTEVGNGDKPESREVHTHR